MAVESRRARRLLSVGYGIGFLLVALPLLEWSLTVWPFRPGTSSWRFASVGLLSQALIQPIVGCALIAVTAFGLSHRLALRLCAGLYLAGALAILGVVGIFALDSIEMRAVVADPVQLQVEVTGVRVFLTYLAYAAMLSWLAVGSWGVGKRRPGERDAKTDDGRAKLIVAR